MVSRKTNSKFVLSLTYMADRQLNTKKDAAKYELPQEGFFLTQFPSLGIFIKDWPGKGHNSKIKIVNGEKFRNDFIFLPAFYLSIWS